MILLYVRVSGKRNSGHKLTAPAPEHDHSFALYWADFL